MALTTCRVQFDSSDFMVVFTKMFILAISACHGHCLLGAARNFCSSDQASVSDMGYVVNKVPSHCIGSGPRCYVLFMADLHKTKAQLLLGFCICTFGLYLCISSTFYLNNHYFCIVLNF